METKSCVGCGSPYENEHRFNCPFNSTQNDPPKYMEAAKRHETVFRMILDAYGKDHKDLSIEEVCRKYSSGDRYGIWTILDFKEVESGIYEFSEEDIALLSGYGATVLFKIENGEVKHLKNISVWMA